MNQPCPSLVAAQAEQVAPAPGKDAKAKKRIYFLDMMKALAVLMMVEGHTVDACLDAVSRNSDSLAYAVWLGVRGFTAPIFMFSSGVVFTYLLRSNPLPFFENPRVRKGFVRFLTLVAIGYLLRYPGQHFLDFSTVTDNQWKVFFTVDALHLIGFGLLAILALALLEELLAILRIRGGLVFLCGAVFFFAISHYTEPVRWTDHFPTFVAAYFSHGTGSYFPLFPWAGYVLSGAVLGSWLARHPDAFSSPAFSKRLLGAGVGILTVSLLLDYCERALYQENVLWIDQIGLLARRVGGVLLLNGVMSAIAQRLKSVPRLVRQVGRHTLVIYVVHLLLLYGCAWFPGMRALQKKLDVTEAALAAVAMIALMVLMVIAIERVKSMFRGERKPLA